MVAVKTTAKRYSVRVEREVIVYAESVASAKSKVIRYVKAGRIEAPAARDVKVTSVKRLPPIEKEGHGPTVDVAPARETRK